MDHGMAYQNMGGDWDPKGKDKKEYKGQGLKGIDGQ